MAIVSSFDMGKAGLTRLIASPSSHFSGREETIRDRVDAPMLSSRHGSVGWRCAQRLQEFEHLSGDVAFQAAEYLEFAPPLGQASGHVGLL